MVAWTTTMAMAFQTPRMICPGETAHPQWDSDRDGCLDDDDGDRVPNMQDVCPTVMAAAQDDVDRDGCIDQEEEEWKMLIHAEGCWGCILEVNSIVVKVDGAKLHEPSWDPPLLLGGDVSSWQHMLSEHAWFNAENFEEVELEIDMKFGYITPTTSGRQFNWFDPVPTFTGPITFWNVDFQLDNGIKFNQEHVARLSSNSYHLYNTFHKHTFTWSKEPLLTLMETVMVFQASLTAVNAPRGVPPYRTSRIPVSLRDTTSTMHILPMGHNGRIPTATDTEITRPEPMEITSQTTPRNGVTEMAMDTATIRRMPRSGW